MYWKSRKDISINKVRVVRSEERVSNHEGRMNLYEFFIKFIVGLSDHEK